MSTWTCADCGATGHAETTKGAAKGLEHHWMDTHRGEGE